MLASSHGNVLKPGLARERIDPILHFTSIDVWQTRNSIRSRRHHCQAFPGEHEENISLILAPERCAKGTPTLTGTFHKFKFMYFTCPYSGYFLHWVSSEIGRRRGGRAVSSVQLKRRYYGWLPNGDPALGPFITSSEPKSLGGGITQKVDRQRLYERAASASNRCAS